MIVIFHLCLIGLTTEKDSCDHVYYFTSQNNFFPGFNTSTSSNASTVIEQPIVNDYKIAESKISTVMPQASKAEGLAFKPPLMIEQVLL